MVLADSHGISRVPRYSGTCPASQLTISPTGLSPSMAHFPDRSTIVLVGNSSALRPDRPYNPSVQAPWFGLFRVRSPLLAESLLFSVPAGTEMVHFPALPSTDLCIQSGIPRYDPGGFPHSEISGSKPVCSSPKLIAAYHVLHRLLAPRHSPYALSSLTIRTLDSSPRGPRRTRCRICFAHTAVWSKELPFAGYSVVKDCLPRTSVLRQTRTRGLRASSVLHPRPCSTTASSLLAYRFMDRTAPSSELVENTGLEPVTSWLQTRRSPS